MKAASVAQLRKELKYRSSEELESLCLRLARFKKENKELLTYLLFESENEVHYVAQVKEDMDAKFDEINKSSIYYIKKSVRRILRETKKYIRYSNVKETEVELLLYFCERFISFKPSLKKNLSMRNLLQRQIQLIHTKIAGLHDDLQYDYTIELNSLKDKLRKH